jgi:hypothetical protein
MNLISDANGIYIPKMFAEQFFNWEGISEEDLATLKRGPEDVGYWDAWDDVLANASHVDERGHLWRLQQEGDLFAVCWKLVNEAREEQFYD